MNNIICLDELNKNSKLDITNIVDTGLEKIQNNFLQGKFGEVINNAINVGIRSIAPDLIEDQIINIKDTLLENGVKEAINQAISSGMDLGKSAIGIFTGEFENLNQIEQAVKKGGVIDTISTILDKSIDFAKDKNLIDKNIANSISAGKKAIINNVSNKLEESLKLQVNSIERLEKYCESWKSAYKEQDLNSMNKLFNNIQKQLKNIVPLENTINKAREIENLQTLITNNGGNFDISNEELELARIL